MRIEELIMNLILAIQDDNLEDTKTFVDFFNSIYDTIDPELNIWLLLDIHNPETYNIDNQSIEYILQNLKGLINPEVARWNRQKYKLLHFNDDLQSIEDFVNSQLENKTYNIDDSLFIQGLIQLTVKLNDNAKTKMIFDKIKMLVKEEI